MPVSQQGKGGSPFFFTVLPPLLVLTVLIGLLETASAARLLPMTVPAPSAVARALVDNFEDLMFHAQATVSSAAMGYVAAVTIAVALAGIAVSWRRTERPISTLAILIDSVPLLAVAPIFVLWMGNGQVLHVFLAAVACFFPLLIGAMQGFRSVDKNVGELFHVLAASPWQKLLKLSLPNALPYLFSAFKVAAPLAILGSLIAEWMGSDRGLGAMIIYALFSFNVPVTWLAILAISVLAMAIYALFAFAESRIVTWTRVSGAGRAT